MSEIKQEVEDYEEGFKLDLALTKHSGGATKRQGDECHEKLVLEEEWVFTPNALILPSQKHLPYAVWVEDDSFLDQLSLVTGRDSLDFEDALGRALENSIPENTKRAYVGDIRYIGAWLLLMGNNFQEPLTEKWVQRFIVDHLEGFKNEQSQKVELRLIREGFKAKAGPHSYDTVKRRLAALSNYCKSKGWLNVARSEPVRFLMRQLSKHYASSKQPTAITRNHLINLMDQTGDGKIGVRDKALLSFMFASGGRRRVEAEEARIEDLEDLGDCFLFHMRRSKTNKTGKSEPKPVTGNAAKYLHRWLSVLGEKEGPLFRPITKAGVIKPMALKGVFISRIVKKLSKKAEYDPKDFSAHSLRSGFVSQAAREGCSMPEVKALTGHRTDAMVSRYYQQGDVLRSRAGNLL